MRLVAKSKQAPCMLQSQAPRTARALETKSTLCCRLARRRGAKQGPNRALELFSHKFRARCRRSRPKERIILKPSPVSVERTRTNQMVCQHSNTTSRGPCEYCRGRPLPMVGPGARKIIRSDPFEELRHRIDLIIVFAMREPFELSKQLIEEACTGTQQDSALAKQVEVSAKPRKFVTMRLPVSREVCAAQFRLQSFGRHSPFGRSEGRIPLVFFACAIVDW